MPTLGLGYLYGMPARLVIKVSTTEGLESAIKLGLDIMCDHWVELIIGRHASRAGDKNWDYRIKDINITCKQKSLVDNTWLSARLAIKFFTTGSGPRWR